MEAEFILFLTDEEYTKSFFNILLTNGIKPIIMPQPFDFEKINENTKGLIIDFDFPEEITDNILTKLKEKFPDFPFLLIGISLKITNEKLSKLKSYNLISYLLKPLDFKTVQQKMNNFFEKFKNQFPGRKYIRIQPSEDEMITVNFRFGDKNYSGKLLDISIGGMLVYIYSKEVDLPFKNVSIIDEININFGTKNITVKAKTVNCEGKKVAFSFLSFLDNSYAVLQKYIIKKLTL